MSHLILLGDSIFDNAAYIGDRLPVVEQVRSLLPADWKATLIAIDGNVTSDVERQLARLPADATHLAISVGGNDALHASGILRSKVSTVAAALELLTDIRGEFRSNYRHMLGKVQETGKPAVVCTIYDSIPGLGEAERTALALFNDIIIREAAAVSIPIADLRSICSEADDYSTRSPIEPSHLGGAKIAAALIRAATTHAFALRRSSFYS